MQPIRLSRLSTMFLAMALIVSMLYVPRANAQIDTTFGAPVEVATPLKSATSIAIYDSVVGTEDGANVLYTALAGEPAVFYVINLDTYQVVRSLPMPQGKDSWSMVVAPNGDVFISSSGGRLYRYSPATKEIEELGLIRPGQTAIYGLSVDEAGNVYGGTYPSALVWKYDPVTKQFSDYGRMSETNSYVRSLAYYGNYLYAGVGEKGSLVKLDPATGEKTQIPLPPVAGVTGDNYPFVYQLDVVDKYLFAHLSGGGISTLIAYDLENEVWREEQFPNFHGNRISKAMNGKAYYKLNGTGGNRLVELDLATFETRVTDMVQDFSLKGGGWVNIQGDPLLPGATLVNIRFDGKVGFFNIETETYYEKPAIVEGQAIPIHSLEKGPDGKLYMTGYPGGTAAAYDPATGTTATFGMGQAESIGQIGSDVYFNVYPKAAIYRYDTTKPVDGTNPALVFNIGEAQDRPYVNLTVGSTMYLGTIPDYGELGGALVAYDSASDTFEVFRNVVQDQSVVGLAHKDGKIYGSTTVLGGLDAVPTATAAKMFVWDVATKTKIVEFTPNLPGSVPKMISGLTFGPDGLLWAAADGTIFAIDPDTYEVVKSKVVYPGVSNYGMWRPIHLRWGTDGLLYTDLYGKLTIVHPETLEFVDLGISTALFTLGDDHNIYYADSTKLMKITVNPGENPGGPVDPEDPPVEEPTSSVFNGSFERPVVNGVIPGWSQFFDDLLPGTSYSVSDERAFTGNYSLKVIDTSASAPVAIVSDPIAIIPGEQYTATVQLFLEQGRGSFMARFYDETGKQTGGDLIQHVQTGQGAWQQVTVSGTAPANAKTIRVFASISLAWTTNGAFYDDFNVTGKFPTTEAPAGSFAIHMPSNEVQLNGIVPVQVKVEDANQLYAVKGVVTYDPAKLNVESVALNDQFAGGNSVFFQYNDSTPGVVQFIASQTGSNAVNGDVTVADIQFKAMQEGDAAVTITTASELAKIDADETGKTESPHANVTATVSIVKDFADVIGNDGVNLNDLVAVAKRIGGAYDKQFDVNRDGVINIQDVSVIALRLLD